MADALERHADRVAQQGVEDESPFRFCRVSAISAGVSATIDYGGTSIVIPKVQMFCAAFPVAGDWVCIGVNGNDRFILGKRL